MSYLKLFSYVGRVGRREFWMTYIALVIFMNLIAFGLRAMESILRGPDAGPQVMAFGTIVLVLGFLLTVLSMWGYLVLTIKRVHDWGGRGWYAVVHAFIPVLLMVPVVTLILVGVSPVTAFQVCALALLPWSVWWCWYCGFAPSDAEPNAYGAPHSGSVRPPA